MADSTTTEARVSGWWGRKDGISAPWCTQSGWREADWRWSKRRGWYAASATLRNVVGITWSGEPVLGEPKKVV